VGRGAAPDIMCVAKALAAASRWGVPGHREAAQAWRRARTAPPTAAIRWPWRSAWRGGGDHQAELLAHVRRGRYFIQQFSACRPLSDIIEDVRQGLLIGVKLKTPTANSCSTPRPAPVDRGGRMRASATALTLTSMSREAMHKFEQPARGQGEAAA